MRRERLRPFATLDEPRGAVTVRCPQSTSLPAGVWIVDAPIESFGVEAQRIGHAQHHHAAIRVGDETIVEVAGGHRHILAQAEDVVLVHPCVVTRFRAVISYAFEAGARVFVKRPAFRAMIASGLGPIEGTLAFTTVKAAEVAAGKRHPYDAFLVDVTAAHAKAGRRYVVDLGQGGFRGMGARHNPYHRAGISADSSPDGTVYRARHHRVEAGHDAFVLGGIDRLVGLDVVVSLAVPVGVQDQRRPAL